MMSGLVLKMGGVPLLYGLWRTRDRDNWGNACRGHERLEGIIDALTGPFAAALDFGFKDHPAMTDPWRRSRQAPQNSN